MAECRLIRSGEMYTGKQGFDYFAGVSAESAGSQGLCMHRLDIPPGVRGEPHLHSEHESAIFVISGEAVMWHGENLEHRMDVSAGDFVYIPAGVPHLPANLSDEPVVAVLARTDPNEQESVLLRPDLSAE